jgi:hypothetical protein
MDVLNHNFIRLGLTRAKVLQTISRFPRETHRRFALPISNALTLHQQSAKKKPLKIGGAFFKMLCKINN